MQYLSSIKTQATKSLRFIMMVSKHFIENGGVYRASALTFTTLLAIVPLMSVSISILAAFPMFKNISAPLQDFIFENFVPATGKVVQTYLLSFAEQASRLSVTGVIFLFVTAVLMMFAIEEALNTVWRVRRRRKGTSAFLLYWALLTLAPIFIGLTIVLSSYVIAMPIFNGGRVNLASAQSWLLSALPLTLAVLTFTLLYVVVPNTRVRIWHGFLGACFTAICLEVAKVGFSYYVQQFDTYQLLYGAFATLPIFFMWLYYVWVIVLIGAEVCHGLAAHYDRRLTGRHDPFTHALRWLHHLWHAQQQGKAMSLQALVDADCHNYIVEPGEQIEQLLECHLIAINDSGDYMLAADLSKMTLYELRQILPWKFPIASALDANDSALEKKLLKIVDDFDKTMQEKLGLSVTSLFDSK